MGSSRQRLGLRVTAVAIGIAVGAALLQALVQPGARAQDGELPARGQALYGAQCAICHGEAGRGTSIGPPLTGVGRASVDFMLRTGRMPLPDRDVKMQRGPQQVSDEEREALVEFVAGLTPDEGPDIPDVSDWEDADLARGLELFTSNCAACHGPTAAGVAVGQRDVSSPLDVASPLEIAEAVRTGPGVMPVFAEEAFPQEDLDALVAWVMDLRDRAAPGGARIGRSGPVSEGLVAWLIGFGLLAVVMYLLGAKTEDDGAGHD